VGEGDVQRGRPEQVIVPVDAEQPKPVLEVCDSGGEHQASEIQDVVEREGWRRDLLGRERQRASEAVPETAGEDGGQRDEEDGIAGCREMLAQRPANAARNRDDAEIEQRVELEKAREALPADDGQEERVLLRGDEIRGPPLLQVTLSRHRLS